jgi:hypothetical protein
MGLVTKKTVSISMKLWKSSWLNIYFAKQNDFKEIIDEGC